MRLPRIFTALFVCLMLAAVAVVAWRSVSGELLSAKAADVQLSLETSRQREIKQQKEYEAVSTELPQVKAALAEAEPLAEAAKQQESDLRARRKALRAEIAGQETAAQQAEEGLSALRTTLGEELLHAREDDALAALEQLNTLLQGLPDALDEQRSDL